MRRFGTQMNCPATSGLAQLRNLSSYWKERASPLMAVLGRTVSDNESLCQLGLSAPDRGRGEAVGRG
jgi:hypothetical protein